MYGFPYFRYIVASLVLYRVNVCALATGNLKFKSLHTGKMEGFCFALCQSNISREKGFCFFTYFLHLFDWISTVNG